MARDTMSAPRLDTNLLPDDGGSGLLLSPGGYDDDAASLYSRSEQDTDSDDDELQNRARNSRELLARDRLVLMDEEEMEGLVADSRKKQERRRRGSGLNVPNPLKMLKRRGSDVSLSRSLDFSRSQDNLVAEKRHARRARRQQKKNRLMEGAMHGEDGELMYEMESGGIKDGSSTGESSDRDDSDEVDRRQLGMVAGDKARRTRSWRRWLLIHSLIVIGFAILVLLAWKLSKSRKSGPAANGHYASNGTALFAPTTIIISLDGFRADFLQRGITPRLNDFVKQGVSPKYMLPSFPSVTFPNHYTIATGLHPESHGVVGNTFWDPDIRAHFHNTDPSESLDPKWWGGEPFWVTAEKEGVRTAIHMWPGSEAHILNMEPSFVDKYNGDESLENKVARIFQFLDRPGKENAQATVSEMRPQLIAAYVPNVDSDGHKYGPNSTEIRATIEKADNLVDGVFKGLEERNLTDIVNVIVVSDHGMATTDKSRVIQLEDLIDTSKIEHMDGWPLYGLRPREPADLQPLYDELSEKAKANPNIDVYLRDENMPERYHFSNNDRIAPLWIVPKAGWAVATKDDFDVAKAAEDGSVYRPRGLHGYDHEHPLMRAIFIARGPAFPHPANSEIPVFRKHLCPRPLTCTCSDFFFFALLENIEVYNMLCDSVGIEPKPNNGTLRLPLKPVGTHKAEDTPETPPDPEPERPADPSSGLGVTMPSAPAAHEDGGSEDEEKKKGGGEAPHDEPSDKDGNGKADEGDGNDSEGSHWTDSVSDMFNWVKGEVSRVWDSVWDW